MTSAKNSGIFRTIQMIPEEIQLRRKLTGLRISRSHAINALDTANKAASKQIRAKIERLRVTWKELTARLKRLEEEKANADDPLRSTQAVLEHHLAAIDSGDMDSILADYHADAVLLTSEGVHRGHEQIKLVLRKLLDNVFTNCTEFKMIRQSVEGDVAFIVWSAESEKFTVQMATDTYLVRFGKIVAQTFVAEMTKK